MIGASHSLNGANAGAASSFMVLEKSISDITRQINQKLSKSILDPHDEFITKADDFDWRNKLNQSKMEWLEKN